MNPPFRADHVGSLLRPSRVDKDAIREGVARQEAIGLQGITDGEFSRQWWHLDFLSQLEGVTLRENPGPKFGGTEEQPPIPIVTGKVRYSRPIMVDDFRFLKTLTRRTPKFTIPSPSMLHLRAGRKGVAYDDMDEFWAAGCTCLQLDDVAFAYLCDPKIRDACRRNGDDPDALPARYARTIRKALKGKPAGMTIAMHTWRGNFRSAWVAEGGYEPVAEAMFSSGVDAFFMEFDSELGLVSSRTPQLEPRDHVKRRIDQAARYVPLERLCLSPQCGFSSTHHGNKLTPDDQWRKLSLVVETASEVWN